MQVWGCGGVTWAGDTHLAHRAAGAPPLSSCRNAEPGARPGCSRRSLDVEQTEFKREATLSDTAPEVPPGAGSKKSSLSEIKEFSHQVFPPVPRGFARTKPWNIPRAEQG